MLRGVGDVLARHLLMYFDDPETIFKSKKQVLEKVPGIGAYTAEQIFNSIPEALKSAGKEMNFIEKNEISVFSMNNADYPGRLKECPDAPTVFYYKGKADLNAAKIISIVGTRRITEYGRTVIEALLKDLSKMFPDTVIVSGLAYGIDVCAHKNALKNNLPTVAVLAHGLDRIYPSMHRNIAAEMLNKGGILTDYPSNTVPDRENFLQRNRLIAGLSDATIIVESAEKGGALVTADIAVSYSRDVFAFPGRITDEFSAGCNHLIRKNKAALITCAKDLVMALRWDTEVKKSPRQQVLPFAERPEHPIIKLLAEKGAFQINELAAEMNISVHKLIQTLFELELEGHIKTLPGGIYKLS
jgi:DNA processing protein